LVVVLLLTKETQQTNPYPSGVNDEKGLPKDDQVKPPKGL
jgi:hypothetical protein